MGGLLLGRAFRYYGKKRGHRRTGSPTLGVGLEAAFSALFLLAGCGGLALLFNGEVVPRWRVNQEFIETGCKVLEKQIEEKQGDDGLEFRPKLNIEYVKIQTPSYYDINETPYNNREDAQAILDRFELYSPERNNLYPCWYDPANPYTVVLSRGYPRWLWFAFAVPLSLIVIGAGGLIHTLFGWGKSAERRSVLSRNGVERDFLGIRGHGDRRCPFVPEGADVTNSPGTKLKFRLPISGSPAWALLGILTFCVIWNGVVTVFVVIAVDGHLEGKPDWFLTLFTIPFVLVGFGAIVIFLRKLLVAAGIGPTRLEISDHPLHPGEKYRVFLSQSGRLDMNTLRVSLTCEESATYRQGTDTRTETREVFRSELFFHTGFVIHGGLPFETDIEFDVPKGAMHSFAAKNNEINWALMVEGDVAGWPNYRRAFTVIVRPIVGDPDR